jgi:hypothetical protein
MRWTTAVMALGAGVVVLGAAGPSAASSAPSGPLAITWLAAGDSFASGQGLTRTTEPCADGTGTGGLGTTWAIAAAEDLEGKGAAPKPLTPMKMAKGSPDLVACTGAISADFFHDNSTKLKSNKHEEQWQKGMKPFDLVTFSFGGDDIGFSDIVTHCLTIGCPSDADVRAKISELGSTGLDFKGVKTQGYPAFLESVAKTAVVKGGNIVVMGYPEVIEDPTLWGPDRQTCDTLSVAEAQVMRGWAGDLNATIGNAVASVDALPAAQRNGVHVTFVDAVSGSSDDGIAGTDPNLFEPSSGTRHELCSGGGQVWLNGLAPLHLRTRSFHPNQDGETAMGALATEVISKLTWPWTKTLATTTCPTSSVTPNPKPPAATEAVNGDLGALGPVTLDSDNEQVAQIVGPSGWTCEAGIGGDGDTQLTVIAPGSSLDANHDITSGIQAFVIPGADVLDQYLMTCALFPSSVTAAVSGASGGGIGFDCGSAPPASESDTRVGSTAVFFTDPVGTHGTWDNSAGLYPADGVVIFNPNTDGKQGLDTTEQAECILPPADQSLCTAALDDFAARYGVVTLPITDAQSGLPADTAAAPACPSAAQVMAAWQHSPGIDLAGPGDTITGFTGVSCWEDWVLATPTDTLGGNGQFYFSQVGGLHGVSGAESTQVNRDECFDAMAPPEWSALGESCFSGNTGNS